MGRYIVGTSGWHYNDWKGKFYPEHLPRSRWLEFYSREFPTVELNNTFYRLPSEEAVRSWVESTPRDFTFAVKASRFITHIERLKNTQKALDTFLDRTTILGIKLGPILFQLPPSFHRDLEVLKQFLGSLPGYVRAVFEFRHESWMEGGVFEVLRQHRAGFCVFDQPGFSCPVVATAGFSYFRFHGSSSLYTSSYSDEELKSWASKIASIARDVETTYIYFNNDTQGYALDNARTLRSLLLHQEQM